MNTYKLKIKITSSLGTPPAADTIWGHICWGIRYREGKDALEAFLAEYDSGPPPLLMSNPFPQGYMPIPEVPNFRTKTENRLAYSTVKQLNKARFVPEEYYSCGSAISKNGVIGYLYENSYKQDPQPTSKTIVAHNTINRLTGAVLKPEEKDDPSGLFFTEEYHIDTANPPLMDIYVLSKYPQERIVEMFDWAFEAGYGKYASRGKGRIETAGIEEHTMPHADKPNAVMLLASCLPAQNDPTDGYWQLFIRFGKLGGHFASGSMDEIGVDENLPFKYPITMLRAGSVFKTDSPSLFYGRVATGVHSVSKIRHCGLAPALAINCDFGGKP